MAAAAILVVAERQEGCVENKVLVVAIQTVKEPREDYAGNKATVAVVRKAGIEVVHTAEDSAADIVSGPGRLAVQVALREKIQVDRVARGSI